MGERVAQEGHSRQLPVGYREKHGQAGGYRDAGDTGWEGYRDAGVTWRGACGPHPWAGIPLEGAAVHEAARWLEVTDRHVGGGLAVPLLLQPVLALAIGGRSVALIAHEGFLLAPPKSLVLVALRGAEAVWPVGWVDGCVCGVGGGECEGIVLHGNMSSPSHHHQKVKGVQENPHITHIPQSKRSDYNNGYD